MGFLRIHGCEKKNIQAFSFVNLCLNLRLTRVPIILQNFTISFGKSGFIIKYEFSVGF